MNCSDRTIHEGMVLLFRDRKSYRFWQSKLGIARVLRLDERRGTAHIRTYRQTEADPAIQIGHLPVTLSALNSSIKTLLGVQPGILDSETAVLIEAWEKKFDEKRAAAFADSIAAARDYALGSIAPDALTRPGLVILSAYPVVGAGGDYSKVEALVGRLGD